MKRIFYLTAIFAALTMGGFAQVKPMDFSGTWSLDIAKSQIHERQRIESMTMTIVQTDKELKVTTVTKRQAPPADAPADGAGGGRRMGGRFGADGTVTYSLDGKETVVEIDGPNGKLPVKYKASAEPGKINLSSIRNLSGPMGEITITSKDTWTLSPDGKTLTVVREQTSPRGTNSSTTVFVKS